MRHTFKPLEREPVYMKVSRAIEEEIVSGALPEGALLPTEGDLCEQFGVTRSSVREGIRLLEQSGLVERGPAKRLRVRAPKMSEIAATASRSLAHGGATFREVWEALAGFYPQAVRLASARMTTEKLQDLKDINHRLRGNSDASVTVECAESFFHAIAAGLDNRVMLAMLQSLNIMIGASLAHVIGETPRAKKRIEEAQKQIIAALEAGDADKAAEWMTRHIDDLMRGYQVAKADLEARIL